MTRQIDLRIDVTNALALGVPAHIAASVVLPDQLPADTSLGRPVVCFAKPGGGYASGYFTCELPGPPSETHYGSQAEFHTARGWIFVAMDNLGSGASSVLASELLTFTNCARAALAAEEEILLRLANGLIEGFAPVLQPVRLAIGQSTGGCLAIVQQARHRCYDGIGILGFSAVHSHPATPPGETPVVTPWFSRDLAPDQPGGVLNAPAITAAAADERRGSAWNALAWGFHYDDVPAEVLEQDLAHYDAIAYGTGHAGMPIEVRDPAPWISYTTPHEAARMVLTPGIVAPEAAAVTVPVLSAMGERDLVVDPLGEARAFRSAPSFDLFICPRMGHVHNFAGTRRLFWERIHRFGEWCAAAKGTIP